MKRIAIIVFAGLCLCLGLWIALGGSHEATPDAFYGGRSAESWLTDYSTTNQTAMYDAFRIMGTNAFPTLIRELRRRDSPLDRLRQFLYWKLPIWVRRHLTRPQTQTERIGAVQLIIWRNHERGFLPSLLQVANEEHGNFRDGLAAVMAGVVGPGDTNAVPLLIEALQRKNGLARGPVALGLAQIGPEAKTAVPALKSAMAETNTLLRLGAARALWQITGQTNVVIEAFQSVVNDLTQAGPNRTIATGFLHDIESPDISVIPVFISWLGDPGHTLQVKAADSLAKLGPPARAAVPALVKMTSSANEEERQSALRALRAIDPNAAAAHESAANKLP